jgi:hypothetical protein
MDEGHIEVQSGETSPIAPVHWSERFPELERLFATHLVEDWRSLYASPADAIDAGIVDRSLDELRLVLAELNELLRLRLSEPELRDVLSYDLGSCYIPGSRTCTDWLEEVVRQVHASVTARIAEASAHSATDK